jgi:hypothetical protein
MGRLWWWTFLGLGAHAVACEFVDAPSSQRQRQLPSGGASGLGGANGGEGGTAGADGIHGGASGMNPGEKGSGGGGGDRATGGASNEGGSAGSSTTDTGGAGNRATGGASNEGGNAGSSATDSGGEAGSEAGSSGTGGAGEGDETIAGIVSQDSLYDGDDEAPTQCAVGGTTMHCCPQGRAMTGLHDGHNVFKCARLTSPNGTRSLSASVRFDMLACPAGQVVVGFHGGLTRLVCQTIPDITVIESAGGVQDGYPMLTCPPSNAGTVSGIDLGGNQLLCAFDVRRQGIGGAKSE